MDTIRINHFKFTIFQTYFIQDEATIHCLDFFHLVARQAYDMGKTGFPVVKSGNPRCPGKRMFQG